MLAGECNPYWVDVEHIDGEPEPSARIDGKCIFTEVVEQDRYTFESPMPTVPSLTISRYEILVDGEVVDKRNVHRSAQRLITPAEYALQLKQVKIYRADNHRFEGFSTYHSRCWGPEGLQDYTVHFVIEFVQPIIHFGI